MERVREWFEDAVHQLFRMAMPFLMLFVSFILTSEVATLISAAAELPSWATTVIMVIMSAGFVGMAILAANGVVRWASIWLLWRQDMADKPDTTEVFVGGLFFAAYVSAVGGILWSLELERSAWVAVLAFEMLNIGMAFVVGYGNVRNEVQAQLTLDEILKLVHEARESLKVAKVRRAKYKETEAQVIKLERTHSSLVTGNKELEGIRNSLVTGNEELEGTRTKLVGGNKELEGIRTKLVGGNKELEGIRNSLVTGNEELEGTRTQLVARVEELEGTRTKLVADSKFEVLARRYAVAHLADGGMSNVQIGVVFGVSDATIRNDKKVINEQK